MIQAGIVGGTGYTGVELLRILANHPQVDIQAVTSRSDAGTAVADIYPSLRGSVHTQFCTPELDRLKQCDVVFFATPNGTAMTMVESLLSSGTKVIDLSADFRIKQVSLWEQWYGLSHACPELLDIAVYGLVEVNRDLIKDAQLIACPGCYPTAVQLGFLPLLEAGLIDPKSLIADVKSGVSGAGRQASMATLMSETGESLKAYAASGHRHLPEIQQGLAQICDAKVQLTFVPHLIPMIRGIHATLYADLKTDLLAIQQCYDKRYTSEPFVEILPAGSHPDTRNVRGSNKCHIAIHRPEGGNRIVILSVIDNLVKGAAGQAVQNLNVMFDLEEEAGLNTIALYP